MKHSNWQDKMNTIPIQDDVEKGWEHMEQLLDEYQPVNISSSRRIGVKKLIAKIVSTLGYVLPAAAMITVGTLVIEPKIRENSHVEVPLSHVSVKKQRNAIANLKLLDSVSSDQDKLDETSDSLIIQKPINKKRTRMRRIVPSEKVFESRSHIDSSDRLDTIIKRRTRVVDTVKSKVEKPKSDTAIRRRRN